MDVYHQKLTFPYGMCRVCIDECKQVYGLSLIKAAGPFVDVTYVPDAEPFAEPRFGLLGVWEGRSAWEWSGVRVGCMVGVCV